MEAYGRLTKHRANLVPTTTQVVRLNSRPPPGGKHEARVLPVGAGPQTFLALRSCVRLQRGHANLRERNRPRRLPSLRSHELQTADGRFDMQLRQGLPFMSRVGDWEMLVGVRSLFRTAFDDRSFYDELLVVRPPKRVMGGLQVRF